MIGYRTLPHGRNRAHYPPHMAQYPKLIGTTESVWSWSDWDLDWEAVYNDPYEPTYLLPEAAMQAAGRIPSHTYRDLRSARRSYQRTRKHPHKKSHRERQCCCCQDTRSHQTRRAWKRSRQDDMHQAHDEHTEDVMYHWRDEGDTKDVCVYFRDFEQHEDFSTWARRRIDETRAMKEARLRSAPTTTLFTTPNDTHAQNVLTSLLVPNNNFMHFLSPNLLHVCGIWRFSPQLFQYFDGIKPWQWDWAFCERCMYKNCVRRCFQWECFMCKGDDVTGVARESGCAALGEWRWARKASRVAEEDKNGAEEDAEWDLVPSVTEEWSMVSEESDFEVL